MIVLDQRGRLRGRWSVVSAARSVHDHHLLASPLPYLVSTLQRAQWSASEQTHFINLKASCWSLKCTEEEWPVLCRTQSLWADSGDGFLFFMWHKKSRPEFSPVQTPLAVPHADSGFNGLWWHVSDPCGPLLSVKRRSRGNPKTIGDGGRIKSLTCSNLVDDTIALLQPLLLFCFIPQRSRLKKLCLMWTLEFLFMLWIVFFCRYQLCF